MGSYIIKRLFHNFFVLLGITFIVFFLLYLSGDPVRLMMPTDATTEEVEAARETMGFKDPFLIQYGNFLARIARLDFGNSLKTQTPAIGLIKEYFFNTLILTTVSFIVALLVAVPVGVFSAIRRNSLFDFLASIFVLLGQATPVYWTGLVLILLFAVQLRWLPSGGFGLTSHLILPAVTLAIFSMSRLARMSRSSMLEVLAQDYVRTARSQGIKEFLVHFKFALKSASIPIITLVGVEFAILLEGSVVTETIFSWPGIGRLVLQAVYDRDYPLVQAVMIVITLIVTFINLGVDILYVVLDPRIRYGRGRK